jgi:tetratricopeptide (TPR) repeat protein
MTRLPDEGPSPPAPEDGAGPPLPINPVEIVPWRPSEEIITDADRRINEKAAGLQRRRRRRGSSGKRESNRASLVTLVGKFVPARSTSGARPAANLPAVSRAPERRSRRSRRHHRGSRPKFRFNGKALLCLALAILLLPILYLGLATLQDGRVRRQALEQAREQAEQGSIDQALLGLAHYLETWPEDVAGLELIARVRTERARSLDELLLAADAQDRLLLADPEGPGRRENRRKLVDLSIRASEESRLGSVRQADPADKNENRSRVAVKIAEQIIASGDDGAGSHRLLAMALESLAASGDSAALPAASLEYERALSRDPGDWDSAERLAWLAYERDSDPGNGDEVLDDLLRASPNSPQVRLARYRFFARTSRLDRALDEIELATVLAPTDPEIRMTAASEAIQRRDPDSARRHLAAIPAGSRDQRRIKKYLGFIELVEKKPDLALDIWRQGLMESSGRDRDLTWRTAYILIQLGRFDEAEPLVDQYGRLAGESDPMLHLLMGIRDEMIGRPLAAIAELGKLGPSIDQAWHPHLATTLGRCFERIDDDPRAMLEYRRAIKELPRSLGAWRSLVRLTRKTDPEAATREVEAALVQLPGEPLLLLDLAKIRLQQQLATTPGEREWSKVNMTLDRATRTGKPDPGLVLIRAEMLSASDRFDEALGLLEKALAGPDRARIDLWLYLADSLAIRGRLDEAMKVLERGSSPDQAGDQASLRAARATLLLRLGQGRAARELLTRGVDAFSVPERIEMARARARVLQTLGDKAGARQACLDWAKLAPLEPDAGLKLLELSRPNDDDEAARLGVELLRNLGVEDEPNVMAARALDLLLSNRTMTETRTARLEKAAALSRKLMARAPRLPVSRLIRGMVLERNHRIEEAIDDYRVALDGETAGMAGDRLTQLYCRLKRYDELVALKDKIHSAVPLDRVAIRLALEQGDKAGAERLIARLVEDRPDDPEAHAAQASVLQEIGKPEAAEETLREAVEQASDRADAWVALVACQAGRGASVEATKTIEQAKADYRGARPDLLNARLCWVAGNRDAAARLYDEATARNAADLATYQAACAFAEAAGRPDRVEALARRALPVRSCSAWAARTLAMLLAKRLDPSAWKEAWSLVAPGGPGAGESPSDRLVRASLLTLSPDPTRWLEASAALTGLIEDLPASDPIGLRARVDLASTLLGANKPAEAARYIAEATEESVAADSASLALAVEILARAGRPDEAEQRLARLSAEPNSSRLACARAWIFLARGKSAEAALTIEDADSLAGKAPEASAKHAQFVNQLLAMGQLDAAERLARKIARLWPKDACVLADFLASRGRTDEALDAARIAADAGATREPLRLAVGLALAGRLDGSQGEKARAIAEAVMGARPRNSGLVLMAVTLANRQGRYDDAMKACRRAFEADPSNPLCQNGLNDMAWIFCELLNRPAEALVEVERVLKVEGSAMAMDTRGVILTRLGRFIEAIEQLERCLRKEPVGHRFLHLARAYQKAGKVEQYRGALERAKKAGINLSALSSKEREEFAAAIGR